MNLIEYFMEHQEVSQEDFLKGIKLMQKYHSLERPSTKEEYISGMHEIFAKYSYDAIYEYLANCCECVSVDKPEEHGCSGYCILCYKKTIEHIKKGC